MATLFVKTSCLGAGLLLAGCSGPGPSPGGGGGGAAAAAWSLGDRTVSYQIQETRPGGSQRDVAMSLAFAGGKVTITEDGHASAGTLDARGRFTPDDAAAPEPYYELALLSVLPDGAPDVGKRWDVVDPPDSDLAASSGILAQQKVSYEITAASDTAVVVTLTGQVRIAPTAGLDALASASSIPAPVVRAAATGWRDHLVGTVTFDPADGSLLKGTGTLVPLAPFFDAKPVDQHPARVEYAASRR